METMQILLNKIYNEVDLKDDVFEYINPYILKAYNLLGENVKSNDKLILESLLNKDLPNLVSKYSCLPLEYRNTKKLKNGKTTKEVFINNIEIIANAINKLEENNISSENDILVQSRYLSDKYQSLDMTEKEEHCENKFQWNESFNKTYIVNKSNDICKKLKVVDGVIVHKKSLKQKISPLMNKVVKVIKSPNATKSIDKKDIINKHTPIITISTIIFLFIIYLISICVYYNKNNYYFYNIQAFNDLSEEIKIDKNNNYLSQLKEKKIKNFENKGNVKLVDKKINDHEVLTMYQVLDKDKCSNMLSNIENMDKTIVIKYKINNINLSSSTSLSKGEINLVCNLPENTMEMSNILE